MNETASTYTVLLLMNATAKWLSLSRQQRAEYGEHSGVPTFGKFSQSCRIRLFDSEYLHGHISD